MTWNPYGTGGYDSTPSRGEEPHGGQAAPSGWSPQSGYGTATSAPDGYGAPTGGPRQHPYGPPTGSSGQHPYGPPTGDAGAHYVPGSPAAAHIGGQAEGRPGLRALAVLLVLGSFAYLGWHGVMWGEPLVEYLDSCRVADGMSCFAAAPVHQWVYAPLLAVVVAWAAASGASVEAKNGRARGYLHLLVGVAALVIGGLVSSL